MLAVSRVALAAAAMLLAVGVGSCGGSDEPAEPAVASVPAGLRAASTPAFRVAFPTAWTATSSRVDTPVQGQVRTIAEGPAGSSGIRPGAVVGATPNAGADADTLAAVNRGDTRIRQPYARVGTPRELTVTGAKGARVIESRVSAVPTADGKSRAVRPGTPGAVVVHQWDVVVATEGGAAVNLYLYVPEPDADGVPVQSIIRSLTVR